jgi:tetratricopeptide (TPR) repeat protein
MPSRLALEDQRWEEAAAVATPDTSFFPWKKFPQWEALNHYGRGLGAARAGKITIADEALVRLMELQTALGTAPQTKYWYDQIEAQMMAIKGWLAYGSDNKDEGYKLLAQAADLEDATVKNPVSPGELLPIREQLGDMLLEMNKPKEALAAYELCLDNRPNRFNSLYGAGLAAERSGDMKTAKMYYSSLLTQTKTGSSKRNRLAHARDVMNPA